MPARLTAVRSVPEGAEIETVANLDVVVCRYEHNGKPCASAYKGNSAKAAWGGPFPTLDRREEYIDAWKRQIAREQAMRLAFREEYEAKLSAFYASLSVGSIFYRLDGYEQTNAYFYEVVEPVNGRHVMVRELKQDRIESAPLSMSGHAVPRKGEYTSEASKWRQKGQIPKIWQAGVEVRVSWYG